MLSCIDSSKTEDDVVNERPKPDIHQDNFAKKYKVCAN